jgi:hypothetical protein
MSEVAVNFGMHSAAFKASTFGKSTCRASETAMFVGCTYCRQSESIDESSIQKKQGTRQGRRQSLRFWPTKQQSSLTIILASAGSIDNMNAEGGLELAMASSKRADCGFVIAETRRNDSQ